MSYVIAQALQEAVYAQLTGDAVLSGLVGNAIFDVVPAGDVPPLYVALGAEVARDKSDMTGGGAEHEFTISVVTHNAGFSTAKAAAAAVSDALVDADLSLSRGQLVGLRFHRARAARVGTSDERQINLIFRARVCDG